MSARRIDWFHSRAPALPRSRICERVGANVARNLIRDLAAHRTELLGRVRRRIERHGRVGRRLGQLRRDMEHLVLPTLGVARLDGTWVCMTVDDPHGGTDRPCIGLESIDPEGHQHRWPIDVSAHALARLAQRGTGSDPEQLHAALRALMRAMLRIERRREARRTRADLEVRFPGGNWLWAARRVRGHWCVTTCLGPDTGLPPEFRALRDVQDRDAAMERSRRRGFTRDARLQEGRAA